MSDIIDNEAKAPAASKKPKVIAAPAAAPAETASAFEFPKFPNFEMPKFEMPKFEMPKFDFAALPPVEVPPALREAAEKAVAQAKANYEKIKTAAEEATDLVEDTYETARAGAVEFNLKTLDALKANADAVFGFAKDLVGVKTFAEAVELQTSFARQQFEALTAQTKELQTIAQKVATETAEPVKTAVAKTMNDMKAA